MALTPQLSNLATPEGTEFPGNVDDFLQLITEYMDIIGLEDFNGINYGSVTPDENNRDKPWFKLSEADRPLGWYGWNGSSWVLLTARATEGTHAEMIAVGSPQGGEMFWVVGSSILKIYDSASAAWKSVVPEQTLTTYDRNYFFDSHQLVGSMAGDTTFNTWFEVDLDDYITDAGLAGTTIKSVIVRIDAKVGPIGFAGPLTADVSGKMWYTDEISTASTDIPRARAICTRNDSDASGASQIVCPIPLNGSTSVYYATTASGSAAGLETKFYLVGFIY